MDHPVFDERALAGLLRQDHRLELGAQLRRLPSVQQTPDLFPLARRAVHALHEVIHLERLAPGA